MGVVQTGHPEKFPEFGSKTWYRIVTEQASATREARFDLIWLPPPSFAGKHSAGYNPKEYFNLSNSYGDFAEHRSMLTALLSNGVEPIADIVINHRDGSHAWADFSNPDWGTWAITRHDEAFTNAASDVFDRPIDQRGAEEERPVEYAQHGGTTYEYGSFRDIDHTDQRVRRDLIRYLLQLRSAGYRGWRFAVGEYDWGAHPAQRGWIWHTAAIPGRLEASSSVFDFTTFFTLRDNKGNFRTWYGFGAGLGMVGDNTDAHPWKNKAVTFLENHDTGFRTNEDGAPEEHHGADSFANNWEVEQGYAQLLTHPGVPTVYWKHYFDWGTNLRDKIQALINARKVAGVNAGSALHLQSNAQMNGIYAARIVGRNGDLYVRVGGGDSEWQPFHSGYANYREYAQGAGWKVWVGLPGNPELQQAPLRAALPVPDYRDPASFEIPDDLLD